MKLNFNLVVTIIVLLVWFILIQGCVSNDTIDSMGNAGSKAIIAGGLSVSGIKLAETRKIKAKTTEQFAKDISNAITRQDLKSQPELIIKSIEGKISVEKNTKYKGWLEGTVFWAIILWLLIIGKYIFDRIKPKTIKTVESTND